MADRPRPSALLTDLYELTMAAAYFENNIRATASFELFVRALPRDRGYLVAAGLEQALDYLESLRFTSEEIDFLRRQEVFRRVSDAFFQSLLSSRVPAAPGGAGGGGGGGGGGGVGGGAGRAHGPEAGVLAARAAFIGGCIGTSNGEAGYPLGLPPPRAPAPPLVL